MKPIIELRNVTKRYGTFLALDDVSLDIPVGVTGLLGPNGAGKSTLIKVLLSLVKLTSGSGTILGKEIGRDWSDIRALVGYSPEDDCYIAGQTGIETVRFTARLSGLPSLEALRRAHEILDFCGMEQERYRNVETFSTGMRQKLKFAQAIVHDPQLIIIDEPTSGLDPEEREAMLKRIVTLASNTGKSIVICTHILPDVQACCESVVIIANGQVRVVDKLETLSRPTSPQFEVTLVDGEAQPFGQVLTSAGLQVAVQSSSLVSVLVDNEQITDQIWKLASENQIGIRSMIPARNSLEQIFLEAVGERTSADS